MLNLLNWDKPLIVNGQQFENSTKALEAFKDFSGPIEIKLNAVGVDIPTTKAEEEEIKIYRVHVKNYMTEKSVPAFDFMKKWNDDVPMPFVVMYGHVVEETKGMLKMKLHARVESNSTACMHCGRKLTNIVSRNYGIGPICGQHMNIAPPETVEKFKEREAEIRKAIEAVNWEGWIIKSAMKEMKIIETKKKEEVA